MHIQHTLISTLSQLERILSKLSNEEYGRQLEILSNASIGQHTRHIIEFLQVLQNDYATGMIITIDAQEINYWKHDGILLNWSLP
jgi:hypothetical protein